MIDAIAIRARPERLTDFERFAIPIAESVMRMLPNHVCSVVPCNGGYGVRLTHEIARYRDLTEIRFVGWVCRERE